MNDTREIMPFDLGGQNMRFGSTEDGIPFVVAADFAKALDYRDATDALRCVEEDEKGTQIVRTLGGPQTLKVLYEDGIWELIFLSRKPEAKALKGQVKAILRKIRETGSFNVAQPSRRDLALMVIEEADRAEVAERRVAELEPKAEAHDTYLTAQGTERLVRQAAKLLGWTEKQLRLFLVEEKFIFHRQAPCGQSQWDHYADHAAHFHPVEKVVEHSWGHCSHYTLYVTAAGIDLIQKRVVKRQAEMRAAIQSAPVG